MSPCVICVVIAREIFLLQSDCPEIPKCITKLKTTIKTETLPLNVVDDQSVSVLFPVNQMSFGQNLLQLVFDKFAKRATCEFF